MDELCVGRVRELDAYPFGQNRGRIAPCPLAYSGTARQTVKLLIRIEIEIEALTLGTVAVQLEVNNGVRRSKCIVVALPSESLGLLPS